MATQEIGTSAEFESSKVLQTKTENTIKDDVYDQQMHSIEEQVYEKEYPKLESAQQIDLMKLMRKKQVLKQKQFNMSKLITPKSKSRNTRNVPSWYSAANSSINISPKYQLRSHSQIVQLPQVKIKKLPFVTGYSSRILDRKQYPPNLSEVNNYYNLMKHLYMQNNVSNFHDLLNLSPPEASNSTHENTQTTFSPPIIFSDPTRKRIIDRNAGYLNSVQNVQNLMHSFKFMNTADSSETVPPVAEKYQGSTKKMEKQKKQDQKITEMSQKILKNQQIQKLIDDISGPKQIQEKKFRLSAQQFESLSKTGTPESISRSSPIEKIDMDTHSSKLDLGASPPPDHHWNIKISSKEKISDTVSESHKKTGSLTESALFQNPMISGRSRGQEMNIVSHSSEIDSQVVKNKLLQVTQTTMNFVPVESKQYEIQKPVLKGANTSFKSLKDVDNEYHIKQEILRGIRSQSTQLDAQNNVRKSVVLEKLTPNLSTSPRRYKQKSFTPKPQTHIPERQSKFFGKFRKESIKKDHRLSTYFNSENFENLLQPNKSPFDEEIITPKKFQRCLQNHFEKTQGAYGLKNRKLMLDIQKSLADRKSKVKVLVQSNYENPIRYYSQLKYYDRLQETQREIDLLNLHQQEVTDKMVMLPDIEARKMRLSRLNQLNLLNQSSPRQEIKMQSILSNKNDLLKKFVEKNSENQFEKELKKLNLTVANQKPPPTEQEDSYTLDSALIMDTSSKSQSNLSIELDLNSRKVQIGNQSLIIDIQDQGIVEILTPDESLPVLNRQQLLQKKQIQFQQTLPRKWTFLKDNNTHYRSMFGSSPKRFETEAELQAKVIQHFTKYLDSIDPAQMNQQLEFFLNQDSSYEKQEQGLQIQYMIHRQKIAVSDIPLDQIYNEKVDMIKKFESRTQRNPGPIKLALMENFIKCDHDQNFMGVPHDLSLINVKCEEYSINKNHIFETNKLNSRVYLSDHERKELIKKLEKAKKNKNPLVCKYYNQFYANLMGACEKHRTMSQEDIFGNSPTEFLQEQDDDFSKLTGQEGIEEIRTYIEEYNKNSLEQKLEIERVQKSRIFNHQSLQIVNNSQSPKSPDMKSAMTKAELQNRLVKLARSFIDKQTFFKSPDKELTKEKEQIRQQKIRKFVQSLYEKFHIEVLQPDLKYLIENSNQYYMNYDAQKESQSSMKEIIGQNLTLQTQVVGVKDIYQQTPEKKFRKYVESDQTTSKTLVEKCIRQEKQSTELNLEQREEILNKIRAHSKEKLMLEKFKKHVLKLKKSEKYMKQNGNFDKFELLDEHTDFHGTYHRKFMELLEIKQTMEANKGLTKDEFAMMSSRDLKKRLFLK